MNVMTFNYMWEKRSEETSDSPTEPGVEVVEDNLWDVACGPAMAWDGRSGLEARQLKIEYAVT